VFDFQPGLGGLWLESEMEDFYIFGHVRHFKEMSDYIREADCNLYNSEDCLMKSDQPHE